MADTKKKKEEDVLEEKTEKTEEIREPSLEDKIAELEGKIKEWEDKYLRLYAEFDNFQKRSKKEKDARYSDALSDVVSEFLPVADNLERALAIEVESEEAKKVLEGVEMVKKQMCDCLTKLEVSEIPAVGESFDPNLHNAVMHIEDDSVGENTIVEEFMKGYKYKDDKVIRYSMVKVAN